MEKRSVFAVALDWVSAWLRLRWARAAVNAAVYRVCCERCRSAGGWELSEVAAKVWARSSGWRPATPRGRAWVCPRCVRETVFCASCEDSLWVRGEGPSDPHWRAATVGTKRVWFCGACLSDPTHTSAARTCPLCHAACERPSDTGCEKCGDGEPASACNRCGSRRWSYRDEWDCSECAGRVAGVQYGCDHDPHEVCPSCPAGVQ